ncbi:DNA repair protein RecO [Chryseobacterium lactis]|uniref:DNA repair protein RecO n=1 Tax=Chryseobacterium lactis TaxID=1241981 RepID=A0A3G6RCC3_CHRLC|nr:DNA repair protein RecO [Chryseobacterium lactis]AZA82320.1 DNA repair protein RecO [Chryseobacterium lactis]AZB02702.1 DNA repair protein RecO [Chryseobacterium lactis]PNW14006.1 DNA repair protein RecO [Chryseobacterium lactis]
MNSQNGFLLSFIKYGENDAVLHCFTEEEGFQTYFLKGVYSKKNKKKALLQPLNQLNFSVTSTRGNGIASVSRFELVKNNDIYTDIKTNTVIFFISDFLNQVLRYENKNIPVYFSIDQFIDELTNRNYQAHLLFLLVILKIQGVAPLLSDGKFLDPETGTFVPNSTHQLFTEEVSLIWKQALSAENLYATKIHSSIRKDFLDSLLVYYHYHITDFKTPASLEVIQQIFE